MVITVSGVALWVVLAAPGPSASSTAPAPPAGPTRAVLKREGFPWYDAETGRVKPVLPWEARFAWLDRFGEWCARLLRRISGWFDWLNRWRLPGGLGLGNLIMIGLVMMLITVVLVVLLELLRRYRPLPDDAAGAAAIRAGSAQRIEGLPAGVRFDASDPWAEAQRLRARGDYAGAVVYLFAHQLLCLDRVQQLRLVPGRTGRQLVRAVGDRQIRALVEPTLRLFELVYYGHRAPSAEAFESVWALALEFESRLSPGAVS